ncbi:MAG: hypothetical protein Q4B07_07140 [Clostridia bacterium]|nr:hypothetical protein [Clostridia bacterium]
MRMKKEIRIVAWLLALLLLFGPFIGCSAGKQKYQVTENTEYNADVYPYVVKTASATWYLAKDDIELMGEDAFYEGLFALLDDAEEDFSDVREALKGYIFEEIPPVEIYTDFSNQAPLSETAAAYYNSMRNFIKLFYGWDAVRASLTHEYVHYLTIACADPATEYGFWVEGIAEYISHFVCKNRLARSVNGGLPAEEIEFARNNGAWDAEEDCMDLMRYFLGGGAIHSSEAMIGQPFYSVTAETIVKSERMLQEPEWFELSYYEACGMVAYLVETYGKDLVFTHWNIRPTPSRMEQAFGKTFVTLYHEWVDWDNAQLKMLGMVP